MASMTQRELAQRLAAVLIIAIGVAVIVVSVAHALGY
jgi:hypothetical protein